MSAPPVAPPVAWAESSLAGRTSQLVSRIGTFCLVELQRLRHDRSELVTRMIQPILWLVVFGKTFSRLRAIPTGDVPYLDYLAPGIIAQSALFVAIFYGIMIIWERDSGVLTKLLVTPTPRVALVAGKAFAAGVRAVAQALIVIVVAAILGVSMTWNPLKLLGVLVVVVLGAAFFASNALYPVDLMPRWLQVISNGNPLSYQVAALRGLLIGTPTNLWLDFAVLAGSSAVGIGTAAALLGRLAR
ncbi:MAG TPA: ABC transporter permease [Jatrophihabitans sp.]|nr:ABC transporter permease [Jatrophihabitans sp.]